jgi:N-acetylmuramoyl-L-alanine amidase
MRQWLFQLGAAGLTVWLLGCASDSAPSRVSGLPVKSAVEAPIQSWSPLDAWAGQYGVEATGPRRKGTNQVYSLRSKAGTMEVVIGSRAARWNGRLLWLGYAPEWTRNRPHVHGIDLSRNLRPLLKPEPWRLSRERSIVIDPGHGGGNRGTRSILSGTKFEKEYSLDWALRLKPLLERKGWTVHLTRDSDVAVSLADRVALADSRKADLFLSLHFNSSFPKLDPSGIETYALTPRGLPSTTVRAGQDDVNVEHPGNAHDPFNLRLATSIHRSLIENTGAQDRGVKRARFMTVLRGQTRPAILIEAGFLSNPDEARLISSPAYRQRLAEAVANAL